VRPATSYVSGTLRPVVGAAVYWIPEWQEESQYREFAGRARPAAYAAKPALHIRPSPQDWLPSFGFGLPNVAMQSFA